MKNKCLKCVFLAALALILASLFALSVSASRKGYANLLLITPSTFGTQGVNVEKLEEFSEGEFLVTYAIRQPVTVQAVNSRHSAVLVGTNHNYIDLMGYATLDGGFFTKYAMDSKNRHITLNETAAFKIFGSNRIAGSILKINGEAWIITGVIQDNDAESMNLYVPAGIAGGRADTVMILTDKTATAAYVKNALKSIGIHDNSYDFIDLSKSSKAFSERFSVAFKSALTAAALLFIFKSGGGLINELRFYCDKLREMYFSEMLLRYRVNFMKTACGILACAAGVAAVLALLLQILGICLTWREVVPITSELTAGDFGQKLIWLRDYQIFDNILFWLCICLVSLGFIFILFRRTDNGGLKNGHAGRYRVYYEKLD